MQRSQQAIQAVVGPIPSLPFQPTAVLLIAGLITTLTAIISGLVVRFIPTWQPGYLVAAVLLVALEAALVRYRMVRGQHLEVGALRYLAAELFLLAVLMRIVATFSQGIASLSSSAERWLRSPLTALDNPFLVCLSVGVFCALLVRTGLSTLAAIAPRPTAPATDDSIEAAFFRAELTTQQRHAFTQLSTRLAWGGALALLALIGQVANFERFGGLSRVLAPEVALAGVGYLICAVLLYSRARLTFMQSRWQNDGADVAPTVTHFWSRASSALVVIVVLLALLLPRSYGLGMLDAIRMGALVLANVFTALFTYIGLIMFGAFGLLLTIPAMLLAFLAMLLGGDDTQPAAPLELPPPVAPPPPSVETTTLGPGIVFWICMALLTGYALLIVLRRQHWAVTLWSRLRSGPLERLFAYLQRFWKGTRSYVGAVGHALTSHRDAEDPTDTEPGLPRRLRRLSPTELVRSLYRTTLEQADRFGLARRSAQTPYEYARDLSEQVPDASEDVTELTDAYVRATYAPQPMTRAEAARVRRPFARLRRRLRGKG